jgi:hypothetical protein
MTINVQETEEGFEISWDPDDPLEGMFNDWTEEDFLAMLRNAAEKVIAEHENTQKNSDSNTFEQEFMEK